MGEGIVVPVPTTKLCVPITASTCLGMAREIAAASAAGADMIEIRIDYLDMNQPHKEMSMLGEAREFSGRTILTCRAAEEGGHYRGDERLRARFIAEAIALVGYIAYLDLEYASCMRSPELRSLPETIRKTAPYPPELSLILSRHDFRKTPSDLTQMLAEMASVKTAFLKIACHANSIMDSIRMLDTLHEWAPSRHTIALSMGETGILTRVLAKKFGAFLTFASLEQGKESAPGQITLHDMRNLYRWDAIGPQTKVYGVIGFPVAHSMSPAIMNAGFSEVSHDGVYLPLRVEPDYESFAVFLDACLERPWLDLRGCSVTIPHKENLLRYVKDRGGYIEPLTQRIGVANTLVIGSDGALAAYNTDYMGALNALCAGLNCNITDLEKYSFAVLGAGGVSRAIIAGLLDYKCKVTVTNRTAVMAQKLVYDFSAEAYVPWTATGPIVGDVVINCTSVGMHPNINESPLVPEQLTKSQVVFDTVYNPIETQLLRIARNLGCRTIDGASMFVRQAAAQFERWTNQKAPVDTMRQVVEKRLSV